jgi:L-ribulose-5-phosphate 4-epimerase
MMPELDALREEVCSANRTLVAAGLVTLTWGNVSGISADRQRIAIKPSGVAYDKLTPDDIVVVDLDGRVVAGNLRPSSDTPTHVALYRAFEHIGGVAHMHSTYAASFAQARRPIPCFGTTHADHFRGPVPVTRPLTKAEVESDYEANTGRVIIERFADLDSKASPGVLVAGHAPFVWGGSATAAVESAIALEAVAEMACHTLSIRPDAVELEAYVLDKHYLRKHGAGRYYGQDVPPQEGS